VKKAAINRGPDVHCPRDARAEKDSIAISHQHTAAADGSTPVSTLNWVARLPNEGAVRVKLATPGESTTASQPNAFRTTTPTRTTPPGPDSAIGRTTSLIPEVEVASDKIDEMLKRPGDVGLSLWRVTN
jgi:hypothetical protein